MGTDVEWGLTFSVNVPGVCVTSVSSVFRCLLNSNHINAYGALPADLGNGIGPKMDRDIKEKKNKAVAS